MTVDAISLAVFENLFASVAEDMGVALQRTSFSPNIKERLDFSCAIFDREGRLVAQAAHVPVHLGSMPASVACALQAFETIRLGDVIILNDPYRGGTHLPDVTMVSPVTIDGEAQFFVASRAHHADVGGAAPGSLPLSTELYQEGIIIPPVKLMEGGELDETLLAMITANSRAPGEREGDLKAQLSAQTLGQRRLGAMIEKHGEARVQEHASELMATSRRMTEDVIRDIPSGQYAFEDVLEGDGQSDSPIPIRVTIRVHRKRMTVDFTGSAPQVAGNLNAVEAVARSAAWYCVRLLAPEEIPVNHGCFQPVQIVAPPHSVLNPDFPAAVAVGNVETSQRVVDVVLGALAEAMPETIPAASQGTMNNVSFGGRYRGRSFVFYETIGGGHGGGPLGDGLSGRHSHMTNTRNTPVEAIEHGLPVRVLAYALREESGGKGRFRGGDGIRRVYEFLETATLTINSERRIRGPYGLHGGGAGRTGINRLIRDGEEEPIPSKATIQVQAGDRLVIETPGGGGWGTAR